MSNPVCDAGPAAVASATATVFAELDRAIVGLRLRERALLRERWTLSRHYREALRQVRSQIDMLEQAKRDLDNAPCGAGSRSVGCGACPARARSGIAPRSMECGASPRSVGYD